MPTTKKSTNSSSVADSVSSLKTDRDKLVADLKILMEDARNLTESSADSSKEYLSEKAEVVRDQMADALEKLKATGKETANLSKEKIDDLEGVIRDNPWKSVGVAVVCGLLLDRFLRK